HSDQHDRNAPEEGAFGAAPVTDEPVEEQTPAPFDAVQRFVPLATLLRDQKLVRFARVAFAAIKLREGRIDVRTVGGAVCSAIHQSEQVARGTSLIAGRDALVTNAVEPEPLAVLPLRP